MNAVGLSGQGTDLTDEVRQQLRHHGLEHEDSAECARQLDATRGLAARASLFVDLGACRLLAGDVSGATAAWRYSVLSGQTAPSARALYNLGLLHAQLGLSGLALEQLGAAIDHDVEPYRSRAIIAAAKVDYVSGNAERAIGALGRLADELRSDAQNQATFAAALFGLANAAELSGHLDQAEQAYRELVAEAEGVVQSDAARALTRVLRAMGKEDEAHAFLDRTDLTHVEPLDALDRVEALTRMGRIDEARELAKTIRVAQLAVHHRFRHVSALLDLGLANAAIDELEVLTDAEGPETLARAAYVLGEIYLAHDMIEPATRMFEEVEEARSRYWSGKASLALGDMARDVGDHRDAAMHWTDAASTSVESTAEAARARLMRAVDGSASDGTNSDRPGRHGALVDMSTEAIEIVTLEDLKAGTDAGADAANAGPEDDESGHPAPEGAFGSDLNADPIWADEGDETASTDVRGIAPAPRVIALKRRPAPVADEQTPAIATAESSDELTGSDADADGALAPEPSQTQDPTPSGRNPYSELAPEPFSVEVKEPNEGSPSPARDGAGRVGRAFSRFT